MMRRVGAMASVIAIAAIAVLGVPSLKADPGLALSTTPGGMSQGAADARYWMLDGTNDYAVSGSFTTTLNVAGETLFSWGNENTGGSARVGAVSDGTDMSMRCYGTAAAGTTFGLANADACALFANAPSRIFIGSVAGAGDVLLGVNGILESTVSSTGLTIVDGLTVDTSTLRVDQTANCVAVGAATCTAGLEVTSIARAMGAASPRFEVVQNAATGVSYVGLFDSVGPTLQSAFAYYGASNTDADFADKTSINTYNGKVMQFAHVADVAAGTTAYEWRDNGGATGVQLMSLNGAGRVSPLLYGSITDCADNAGAAACGAAPSGSVVIDAAATTVVVSTTAVTATSQIFLTVDSSLSTRLGITCNTTPPALYVSARTAATSFTVTATVAPVTNPACLSYHIIN